jgi:SAM-dependent methyltransferase
MENLNFPGRFAEIRAKILGKPSLKFLYLEIYKKFYLISKFNKCGGAIVELGSGAGFIQEFFPDVLTSDIICYSGVDLVCDAQKMPFKSNSLCCLLLNNVLHHIPDTKSFLHEAARCLKIGGKILVSDQFPGWLAKPIYKYIHHEPYDEVRKEWEFPSNGPLSSANGALPWIIFFRDRYIFEKEFKNLDITLIQYHTPTRYWLSGGLKKWNLMPGWLFPLITLLDVFLVRIHPKLGSFFLVEITKNEI